MGMFDMFGDQDRWGINSFTAAVEGGPTEGMLSNQPSSEWMNGLEQALSPQQGPMFPNVMNQQHTQMMPGNNNPTLPGQSQPMTPAKPVEVDEIEMAGQGAESMFSPGQPGGNRAARIGNAAGALTNLYTSRYGFKFR